jgi:hypothetical protein
MLAYYPSSWHDTLRAGIAQMHPARSTDLLFSARGMQLGGALVMMSAAMRLASCMPYMSQLNLPHMSQLDHAIASSPKLLLLLLLCKTAGVCCVRMTHASPHPTAGTTTQQLLHPHPTQKQQQQQQALLQQQMPRLQQEAAALLVQLLLQARSSQTSRQLPKLCRSSTQVRPVTIRLLYCELAHTR